MRPTQSDSTPASATPRIIGQGGLLVLLTLLTYAGALRGDFLWDDDSHVTENPVVIGPLGLKEIWTTAAANYFPLVLTSFRLQHKLWGLHPFGYHAVTLACHVIAAVLLWRVLIQLRVRGAWLGATLWALHPVQVESVAWISELKNTQSAVFFLLCVRMFVRWCESRERPAAFATRAWCEYAWALLFAVLALLSKPSTVMLPAVLLLCCWWQRGGVGRKDVISMLPIAIFAGVAAGWAIWEQRVHSGAAGAEWELGIVGRMIVAGRAVVFYLTKLTWPEPLLFI